jgi:hypothetical protein
MEKLNDTDTTITTSISNTVMIMISRVQNVERPRKNCLMNLKNILNGEYLI